MADLAKGQPHDYVPDFLIRLKGAPERYLILETKGYDREGVNADGSYGEWRHAVAEQATDVLNLIEGAAE